ncbi:bifunctional 2',3'-cyclic-nucleotide 2'-phosphodiesterase/3'-nucleotidase [Streptococcus sanguinis]|jgi:cyclo-nucleotide phosphodiesterase, putative|uniref:Bifunctional 2',3'-cyclic nucleotide 2'-phosphodiesterase/3'-nucleotidase protein n=1 Tax=Streptococcus sanguinis TaxID=1305 RepID=A0A2X3V4D5_STRSA|nr:bifunctional 2',3'-cyclic-nucleotide 2'-phosphodiesterase/3'-nucleotidase [Streptococcus sanguinis]EGJ42632.1 2',3'-cyclic-nucleotide 2'-phosphodiesterase [Streptococcus sanguinis SK1059]EGQ18800.1 2',3'-cyclic-nucleotide 2'-phosphodiesterase [Streptococcus sanguinis ATCC 29667]EGQ25245.1 2',3'-cyclic-nucleotide 2'-phosphodiesterase [Streptococcus sanguinis SK340]RSI20858.1 Trifunctional nucleotide phosphoesterase protein YfkN precursor [Streptococcus sanguinis]RSI33483.1 Trifunctional nucl
MSKSSLQKTVVLLSAAALAAAVNAVQADENTAPVTANPAPVESSAAEAKPTTAASPTEATATPESTEPNSAISPENASGNADALMAMARNVAATEDTKPVEGQTVDLRILATTDLHTNLVNYDYYQDKPVETLGLAKTAVLIEKAKKENPNVLLVDNGDTIQGTPLGTYKAIVDPVEKGEQHPMYAALQALGFEAGTLGNHEFNYGLDYLNRVIETAGLPIVNANVLDPATGKFIYQPYKIIEKTFTDTQGRLTTVKIGVTGIVPPQILNWDKANLEGKVVVRDSVEAIRDIIPEMRKAGADITLVLSHSGIGDDKYEKGEENEGYQIASLPGVDAVVTGHSHAEFPSGNGTGFYEKYPGVDGVNGKINGTPVTMAGKYGDHLGVIDLKLNYTDGKWKVTDSKGSIRKVDTKSNVADQRVIDIAKESHQGTINYVRQQVGTTTAPITSYFSLVKDDPSVQIVNNAQLWYAKQELAGTPEANLPILSAAAPFKAGTRGDATAYTDIPAGPIAIKNVADLYLYDNVTAILKVNGVQLKEWLEMSAGQFNTIDPNNNQPQNLVNTDYRTYNFDVIDGVTYEFDITQPNKYDREGKLANPNASRVRNLKYQGKEIDPNQEFIVVTNNYRSNGNFPGVREASLNRLLNLENRQAIINYILAVKNINPSADQNWHFADTIKGLDLRFLTADKAKNLIGTDGDIVYLAASAQEGFGEYKFVYVAPKTEPVPIEQSISPTIAVEAANLQHSRVDFPVLTAVDPSTNKQAFHRQAGAESLPETGEKNNSFSLLGLFLAGTAAFFKRRKLESS